MTIWDDRILETLRNEGPLSVGELADFDHVRVSRAHVGRRCQRLSKYGLLDAFANGVYSITEEGEKYLDGEVDAGELEDLTESKNGVQA
ncbi:Transcriptional regulator, MarR family [Halanaeroarchaeum sp. HSR-CO]|nr:Transcriptional regulator, MarR family [Halanaeroarchaeum sp. HSR-CO]